MNYPCTVTNPMLKRKPAMNSEKAEDGTYTMAKNFSN